MRWQNRIGKPLLAAGLILAGLPAQGPEPSEVRSRESVPPFQIRVETNLVTVRVVVRDTQGHAVGGLNREDFRLFDEGKPREISGFSVETDTGGQGPAGAESGEAVPALSSAQRFPNRFVTLFFDDLHLADAAVGQTREAAWQYLSKLGPQDRAAIVTSSGQTGVDFTADRNKLHEVLFKIAGHSRTIPNAGQCPRISEYQAYLMDQRQQKDAIDIASAEGFECRCRGVNETVECTETELRQAVAQAAQIWNLADTQSLHALDIADAVIRRMAAMPGQRVIVLVSTGFLTATRGTMIDTLIDRALRQNVTINAIDAAGLYTKDTRDPLLAGRHGLETIKSRMEWEDLNVRRDVLAAVAAGTGGTFFHDSNDFDTGFRTTVKVPELFYTLSFSLSGVKLDGRFHTLKVALRGGGKYDIQARRGYFAKVSDRKPTPSSEIESLIYSQEERYDFPVTVTVRRESAELRVTIHVDIHTLQFRQDGGRNLNTLTFDTAVFDRDGKYVVGKESSLDFRLPDAKLERLRQTGLNAETRFSVSEGAHRIREVVRESEAKKISMLNASAAK